MMTTPTPNDKRVDGNDPRKRIRCAILFHPEERP